MNTDVKLLINTAVEKMLEKTSRTKKLNAMKKKHDVKIHFVPKKYRIFGGLLQSLNIQFGNFIEMLMTIFVENEGRYEVLSKYSGKKNNKFELSEQNDSLIDAYITKCQYGDIDLDAEFHKLLSAIVADNSTKTQAFKHDIDLLFRDKLTGVTYYLEIKYNDDHDTGKFVDINRKFIKTYAYLARELNIKNSDELVPILFFFNNKKLKGNIYVPESTNIKRGKRFFEEFLTVNYDEVDEYMKMLSESGAVIKMFDNLYDKVMSL